MALTRLKQGELKALLGEYDDAADDFESLIATLDALGYEVGEYKAMVAATELCAMAPDLTHRPMTARAQRDLRSRLEERSRSPFQTAWGEAAIASGVERPTAIQRGGP